VQTADGRRVTATTEFDGDLDRLPARRGLHLIALSGPLDVGKASDKTEKPAAHGPEQFFYESKAAKGKLPAHAWPFVTLDSSRDWQARLLACGRGRFYRLLAAALAAEVQSIPAVVSPGLEQQLGPSGNSSPEVLDLFRLVVRERLRLSLVPPVRPEPPWVTLVTAAPDVPLVSLSQWRSPTAGPHQPGGKILLVQVDPSYEMALRPLAVSPHAGWIDYSPRTVLHPKEEVGWVNLRHGFRLRVTGGEGDSPALDYHIAPHETSGAKGSPEGRQLEGPVGSRVPGTWVGGGRQGQAAAVRKKTGRRRRPRPMQVDFRGGGRRGPIRARRRDP
jgi:hypothetical protein